VGNGRVENDLPPQSSDGRKKTLAHRQGSSPGTTHRAGTVVSRSRRTGVKAAGNRKTDKPPGLTSVSIGFSAAKRILMLKVTCLKTVSRRWDFGEDCQNLGGSRAERTSMYKDGRGSRWMGVSSAEK